MEMAAGKASPTPASATPPPVPLWMSMLLVSLISFVIDAVMGSPLVVNLFALLPNPRTTTSELFAYVISLVTDAVKGPDEAPHPSPPLPWMTRLFISLVSLLIDVVRRPDGSVRRSLSRLDVTVGPDANPTSGVRTADVTVDPARSLWFRLFLPTSHGSTGGNIPVVVFFHGGGFAFLSPASRAYDAVCHRICREIRVAVISVNYRLSPEHRCPAPYDDGVDVLRFLDSYSHSSNGCSDDSPGGNLLHLFFEVADLSNCFVTGDSAGANIAHHVARRWTASREAQPPRIRVRLAGLIAIQPFFGGEERVESEVRLAGAPLVNRERTDWLWSAFLPVGADREHEAANPAAAVVNLGEAFPPAMVVVGGFDPLQDWQRRYYESLRKRGKEASLVEYPEAVHGFYVLPGLGASAAPLMEEMRRFVQKHSAAAVQEAVE